MINKFLANFSKNKVQYLVYGSGMFYAVYLHKTFYDLIQRDIKLNKSSFDVDKEIKKILN